MIWLTRLNNRPFAVNSDLIKFVEQSPDTVITLSNGEKLLVLESAEEVRGRVVEFRRTITHGMCALACAAPPAPPANVSHPAENSPGKPAGR